jgi:transcriptional regulator with XRE-family HTH domain
MVRTRRLEMRMTAAEAAERAGISRALLYRIEQGDPACSAGAMFEAAAVMGVPLFEDLRTGGTLSAVLQQSDKMMSLLPQSARRSKVEVFDDF